MTCADARTAMIDAVYGELGAPDGFRLTAHIDGCSPCRQRLGDLRGLLGRMDRWTAPPAMGRIAPRALERIASETATPSSKPRIVAWVQRAAWRDAGPLGKGSITGVLSRAVRRTAWPALTAAAVAMALGVCLPVPSVVEICDRWIHASLGFPAFALALLFLAAAFSAGPLFLGTLVFVRQAGTYGLATGAVHFVIYAALVAPLVYIQSLSLPFTVQALWMAGVVLGVALGGPPSLRWARRRLGVQ